MEEEGSKPVDKLSELGLGFSDSLSQKPLAVEAMEEEGVEKLKSKSKVKSKSKSKSKSKFKSKSKSKSKPPPPSLSAWNEQLRKLVELVKQEVENKPGSYLWRNPRVRKAMTKEATEDDDFLKYNMRRMSVLKNHVKKRIVWLNVMEKDPLSLTGGWDLKRLWRLTCTIWRNGLKTKGLKPLEYFEEFRNRGLIKSVWEFMRNTWKEDKDLTLEEVSCNIHLFFQIHENARQKVIAAKASNKKRSRSSSSLRVSLLKKKKKKYIPIITDDPIPGKDEYDHVMVEARSSNELQGARTEEV